MTGVQKLIMISQRLSFLIRQANFMKQSLHTKTGNWNMSENKGIQV